MAREAFEAVERVRDSKASAYKPSETGAEKHPAQPQAFSLVCAACGAESVPRKNFGLPLARREQRFAVPLTLEDGKAVKMRTDAAREERVARIQKMLRRDRRGDVGGADETNAAASAVVMCSSTIFNVGKSRTIAVERTLDENALAIEDVDVAHR
jgi:hypothetical protein